MSALVVRMPNWVGDAIMSLPAIEALRRAHPDRPIDLLAHPRIDPIAAAVPGIRQVIAVPSRGGAAWNGVVRRLRAAAYDVAIVLAPSFSSALLMAFSGARRRIGRAGQGREWLLTTRLPAEDRRRPQVTQYVDHVRALGFIGEDPALTLPIPPAARAAVTEWLAARHLEPGHFLAVAPGATFGPAKLWPPERFAAVADAVRAARGWPTVLIGAPAEAALLEDVAARVTGGAHRFDRHGLLDALACLGAAGAVLANDTGALHLARAAGAPAVGLFTSTSPEWTGPSPAEGEALVADVACRPCFRRICPLPTGRYACLAAIEPAAVIAALARQADRRPGSNPDPMSNPGPMFDRHPEGP